MLLPIVTESTRGLGFLDGHLQIPSFPGSLSVSLKLCCQTSWKLMLHFLPPLLHLSFITSPAPPCFCPQTCPCRELTVITYVPAQYLSPCVGCLGSMNYWCSPRSCPWPSAHLSATCALIASPFSLLCRMLSGAPAHFHLGLAEHHTLFVSKIGLISLSPNASSSWIPFHSS